MFLQYESFQEVQAAASLEISISRAFEEAFEIKIPYKIVESLMPESTSLKLDSSMAKEYFGWRTTLSSVEAVKQTANWYSKFRRGVDANELMHSELSAYKVGKW